MKRSLDDAVAIGTLTGRLALVTAHRDALQTEVTQLRKDRRRLLDRIEELTDEEIDDHTDR